MMMLPDGFLLCSKQNSSKIIMNLVNLQPMGPACKAKNTEYKNEYYFLCQNNYKQPPKTSMMPLLHNNQDPKIFFFANNQPALTILIAWPQKKLLLNLGTFFLNFFSGPILPTTPHSSRTSTPKGWKKIFVASSQPTSIILTAWAWKGTTLGPGNIFFYFFFDPESPSKSLFDVAKIQKAPRGSKYSIHLAFGYVWWHSRLGLVRFRQNPPSTHWFLRPESPSRSCFDAAKIQNAPRGSKSTLEGCSWPIGTRTDWICLGRHSSWLYKGLNWCWFRFCCLLDSIFFRWDWWIDHCMMGQMLILFLWDLFEPGRYLGGRTRNYNFHD